MSFGLKNAGSTYQRMITRMFEPQLGKNIEIYIDDIVVKKKNEKWQVCVNFTDLNKAYPKDPFPMPQIDQLVDITISHP